MEFPVRDFGLTLAAVNGAYGFTTDGPEILMVLEGSGQVGNETAGKGDSFFITPGETIQCEGIMRLVRAWVP